MSRIFAGTRIKELRKEHGLTQVEMAKQLGFSTSYLNQLENDHRPLTAATLIRLTSVFNVPAEHFSGDRATRVASALQQGLAETLGAQADPTELAEFATRFPELAQNVLALSRLSQQATPQRAPGTAGSETFGTVAPKHPAPHELVRDFFHANSHYFDELDLAAEEVAARLSDDHSYHANPAEKAAKLRELLERDFALSVSTAPPPNVPDRSQAPRRHFDPATRTLYLRKNLSPAQMTFQMAMQLSFLGYADALRRPLAHRLLSSAEAQQLAYFGLAQYFAAAVVMPYERFIEAAQNYRYDIDLLCSHFGTGFETTAVRLSTLQRPGNTGVPLFLLRVDRAGNVSKRQSATSFLFSRRGGSCPLWVIHRAFDSPGDIVRQVAQMPDGHIYFWCARTVIHRHGGFGSQPTEYSIGIGCNIHDAHRLVYSDGLDLSPDCATPIGAGCTTCLRTDCLQRAFPPAGASLLVDESLSPAVPYGYADTKYTVNGH